MASFATARVIVVCDAPAGSSLVHALSRLGLAEVCTVTSLHEARDICRADAANVCLVMLPRAVVDEVPAWSAEDDAPGRGCGIPSLLAVEVVTPYLLKAARSSGYAAVVSVNVAPKLLYRAISATLQKQAQQPAAARDLSPAEAQIIAVDAWTGAKLKLQ